MQEDFVKITNAVYRVLDFLPESDPLKNKAKEKALVVLENITLAFGARPGMVTELLDDILVLEQYLQIGRDQGWISDVNFLIIIKEYNLIKSLIRRELPQSPIKSEMKDLKNEKVKNETKVEQRSVGQYSHRQEKILHILGKREKAQVSDFIKELPNVTKRTVRRDLDDLLKRGRVTRIGEWNQVFYRIVS